MNNSFIALDSTEPILKEEEFDRTPWLRGRETELVKIIEAMKRVAVSDDWSTLKSNIFDGVVEFLEKELLTEAKKDQPDTLKLASLKGQFVWAKKYADLDSLTNAYKNELLGIRKQLNGK